MRQLTACYLALCLAAGGAVGLSPVLHHLIEHGGQGPRHVHWGLAPRAASAPEARAEAHHHGDEHWHRHDAEPVRAIESRRTSLLEHSVERHGVRKFSLSRLARGLARLIETAAPAHPRPAHPADAPADHRHDSVFQLLAGGLVDQAPDALPTVFLPSPRVPCATPASRPAVIRDWDAQTASRGPPAARS